MKTKILLLTGLTAGLLFAAAVPLAALPGPDDYKKLQDEVNKAYLQDQANKAAAKSKASTSTSALAPGTRGWSNGPQNSSTFSPPSNDPKPTTSNLPYTYYDRYTNGSQKRDPLPTNFSGKYTDGSQKPTSDTDDWHKQNKNKHHGDDRYSVDFGPVNSSEPTGSWKKGKKHWNKNSEGATGSSFDNSTYDGSPITYHKPKPTSDTEDWHKKNKYEHHHHDDGNNSYDGSPIHYNKPKPTSDTQGQKWLYLNLPKDGTAKKHHHHGDD